MTDMPQAPDAQPVPAPAPTQGGRYSLTDGGEIFFQKDASNPLPGEFFTKIVQGPGILQPKAADAKAQEWLDIHVRSTLEPLFLLKSEGEGALAGAAAEIGNRLYEHLGVIHRSDLEDQILHLDPDSRKTLRSKGVRLGPVLAFLPALVKPAAIKMRAMLWGLWNGKPLPVTRPADGRVSDVIDPENVDRNFYRMIGYPVFGPRAIRIDMLDRVVTDLYDSAQDGVFEAKNKYAEWLGCNLEGLYSILESMGHRKLKEAAAAEPVAVVDAEAPAPTEAAVIEAPLPADVSVEVAAVVATAKAPAPVVKFMLKKGKMSERPGGSRAGGNRPPRQQKPQRADGNADKPRSENRAAFDPNKPQFKKDKKRDEGGERPRKSFDRDKGRRERDDRDAKPRKGERDDNVGRVYTFEGKKDPNDDGNPFAILKNLKK